MTNLIRCEKSCENIGNGDNYYIINEIFVQGVNKKIEKTINMLVRF